MKNFIQPGNTITMTAPAGGVSSGDGVRIGSVFGVAAYDAAEGDEIELTVVGVFDLPKATGGALTAGDPVFWDAGASKVTATATGNTLIGAAMADAAAPDEIGRVRLNGIFGVASQATADALDVRVDALENP